MHATYDDFKCMHTMLLIFLRHITSTCIICLKIKKLIGTALIEICIGINILATGQDDKADIPITREDSISATIHSATRTLFKSMPMYQLLIMIGPIIGLLYP